jgi:quinol monooxygenase YgiN
MPIYKTANFLVRAGSIERCTDAVRDFVAEMQRSEPGTQLYLSMQDQVNPHRFLHVFVFEDERAEAIHREAAATKRFTELLYPELSGEVKFGDYTLVSTT